MQARSFEKISHISTNPPIQPEANSYDTIAHPILVALIAALPIRTFDATRGGVPDFPSCHYANMPWAYVVHSAMGFCFYGLHTLFNPMFAFWLMSTA